VGGVHVEEAPVARRACRIVDQLTQEEALLHGLEQAAKTRLAGAQGALGRQPLGDVLEEAEKGPAWHRALRDGDRRELEPALPLLVCGAHQAVAQRAAGAERDLHGVLAHSKMSAVGPREAAEARRITEAGQASAEQRFGRAVGEEHAPGVVVDHDALRVGLEQ